MVLLVVNISCDYRAECVSMSSVSKHVKRSVRWQHTVDIPVGHRLQTFIATSFPKNECACRVWWDGESASEHEKNSSLILRLFSLILEAQTSVVGVRQWFGVMDLETTDLICSSFHLPMMLLKPAIQGSAAGLGRPRS